MARLLLAEARPDAILCVTYTKAAAAEMQARLFDQLGGWAVMDDRELAKAVAALQAKQVDRIILTRPAVEAGERLGFLPGGAMAQTGDAPEGAFGNERLAAARRWVAEVVAQGPVPPTPRCPSGSQATTSACSLPSPPPPDRCSRYAGAPGPTR